MTTLELGLIALRLSAVGAFVLAGVCCALGGVVGLPDAVFEYRGSTKNLAVARASADEWNRICGTHLSVVEPPGIGNVRLTELSGLGPGHGGTTWYSGRGERRPVAVDFIDDPWTPQLLLHEMGHVLGKRHDESRPGVMNAIVGHHTFVTPADCP